MKTTKKLLVLLLALLSVATLFTLSSCDNEQPTSNPSVNDPSANEQPQQCLHQWANADCLFPKTCRLCSETEGDALGHSWKNATCTTPKTCTACNKIEGSALGHTEVVDKAVAPTCTAKGLTEGMHCSVCDKILIRQAEIFASGHKWNMPTCITPKMCPVCKITEGEPYGHTFENGECIYCYEEDPNYIALTLTSTAYNINLKDDNEIAYITMVGAETVVYNIDDTSIVVCEWGDWDGDVIPLIFTPVSNGNTFVTVYAEGYDKSIQINVNVEKHFHNYTTSIIEPTCSEQGYTIYSCGCGDTYYSDYTPLSDHIVEYGSCIECEIVIDAYYALAYYVKYNGTEQENGKFYITIEEEYSSTKTFTYYIYTDSSASTISFHMLESDESSSPSVTLITLNLNHDDNHEVILEFHTSAGSSYCWGEITNTFSGSKSEIYNYEYDLAYTTSALIDSHKKLFATEIIVMLCGLELNLLPNFASLSALGFTNI